MQLPDTLRCYGISILLFFFMVIASTQQYCPPPDVPADGKYSYISKQNKFSAGDQVIYTCKDGFTLLGGSKRTCKSSGAWSSATPFCDHPANLKNPVVAGARPSSSISKIIDGNTKTCFGWERSTDYPLQMYLDEQVIVHAIRIFLEKGTTKIQILTGVDNALKTCAEYNRFIETSQWMLIRCTGNAVVADTIRFQSLADRSSNITICEIEAYVKDEYGCEKAPEMRIANGFFEISRNKATLICEDGYQSKNGRLVCEGNSWKSLGPRCDEILCDPFVYNSTVTLNGKWEFVDSVNKIKAGTRRQLKCDSGYEVSGDPVRVTCQKNGTWTGTNARCIGQKSTRTIIFAAVGAGVAVIILTLLGITICLVMKQRSKEVVVVYRSTDGSIATGPGSESEYATAYYESIQPSVPATPRPLVLPPLVSDGYTLPDDNLGTAKRRPMPADIAFGTLKQSTLYGN